MKSIFQLGPAASNVFVIVYVVGTLFLRFYLEEQLQGSILISLSLGAFGLLFLWALYKVGCIQPTLLGLSAKAKIE